MVEYVFYFTAPLQYQPYLPRPPLAKARQCRELGEKIHQIDKQCASEYEHSGSPSVLTQKIQQGSL